MNLSRQQTKYAGIALVVLGIVFAFNLWWLIPAAALAGGGIFAYTQRRLMGRTNEAVQFGLWGVGLALLYMFHFILPGVLLLAGASLLLRGREAEIDGRVQQLITRARSRRRSMASSATTGGTNVSAYQPTRVTIVNEEQPITGETMQLK